MFKSNNGKTSTGMSCNVVSVPFLTTDLSVETQKDMKYTATTVNGVVDILGHICV